MNDRQASTDLAQRAGSAPAPISRDHFERYWGTAKALAASNFFRDARQAEQAFAKILFGADLGLTPTEAMSQIHIIEGRPEVSANLQAQRVKTFRGPDGERYDYRVLELTEEKCVISFRRREQWLFLRGGPRPEWEELGTSEYTVADAQKAGNAAKDNYRKHPRNMLFARAISNGCAWHCPEVMGGLRVYTVGEVEESREMIGEPGAEAEDLSYLEAPERTEPTVPAADAEQHVAAVVEGRLEAAREELRKVDVAIDAAEKLIPRDEDELASLAGERDAIADEIARLEETER